MTIEERAFEYANTNPHGNPYNWSAHHDAYIDGAIDQKVIDDKEYRKDMAYLATKRQELIDKACEWIDKQWDYITEERRSEIKEMFRKAMEE